jgi:hypothetical protein
MHSLFNDAASTVNALQNIIGVIKSRLMGWAGRVGDMKNAYSTLVRKIKGKRSLGRPRRRWKKLE